MSRCQKSWEYAIPGYKTYQSDTTSQEPCASCNHPKQNHLFPVYDGEEPGCFFCKCEGFASHSTGTKESEK